MVNTSEEITNLVAAGQYLEPDYVTRKILTILGDGDKAEEMLSAMSSNEINRIQMLAADGGDAK